MLLLLSVEVYSFRLVGWLVVDGLGFVYFFYICFCFVFICLFLFVLLFLLPSGIISMVIISSSKSCFPLL